MLFRYTAASPIENSKKTLLFQKELHHEKTDMPAMRWIG
jgi:hypothetical protein